MTNRVFAIYQIVLGWKTYEYYCETDELPNPRPTQPKKKIAYKCHFSHSKCFFVGFGDWFIYTGNRLNET